MHAELRVRISRRALKLERELHAISKHPRVGDRRADGTWPIEKLIKKRRRAGKTEYLTRWAGWAPEHDTWESTNLSKEIVDEFNEETAALARARAHPPKAPPPPFFLRSFSLMAASRAASLAWNSSVISRLSGQHAGSGRARYRGSPSCAAADRRGTVPTAAPRFAAPPCRTRTASSKALIGPERLREALAIMDPAKLQMAERERLKLAAQKRRASQAHMYSTATAPARCAFRLLGRVPEVAALQLVRCVLRQVAIAYLNAALISRIGG